MAERRFRSERQDALLTASQRERLIQHHDNPNSEYTAQHRHRIRKRIRHGTADVAFLLTYLGSDDITQAFAFDGDEKSLPPQRETIVSAIAFYLRVCDTRGLDPEDVLSDALIKAHESHESEKVIGHASIDLTVTDRDTALQNATQKLDTDNPDRLSTDELRALAETDYSQLAPLSMPDSQPALRQLVRDNLNTIHAGLEITQSQPRSPSGSVPPDLLATADDGRIAVLEINAPGHETTEESAINRLRDLIMEYGGSQNVIGILVTAVKQTLEIKVTKIHDNQREVSTIPLATLESLGG